jgi:low affinity Fe/Cu permease
MAPKSAAKVSHLMERLAIGVTQWTGSSWAFALAALMTLLWLLSGPLFHYSDTWQLVMNTVSSIVTFLMVFLLQRSQNKDTMAMQIKLNELLAAHRGADNRLINLEDLSEEDVRALHEHYGQLLSKAERTGQIRSRLNTSERLDGGPDRPGPVRPESSETLGKGGK